MNLTLLLAWWNLIYIVPFVLALLYLGLFVFTGITFGEADADFDADADVDVDADADMDADADADVDADADHDFDHDADADHDTDGSSPALAHAASPVHTIALENPEPHASPLFAFLSFLGVGKIPISLALMIFMLAWGAVGFALNALLNNWLGASDIVGVVSVPITLLITMGLTGAAAALIARIMPSDDHRRERRSDLVGKAGEAIYDINAEFGMANVRGNAGDLFQIPCRTVNGNAPIPKGARIVIFDYDREKGVFHVAPFDA